MQISAQLLASSIRCMGVLLQLILVLFNLLFILSVSGLISSRNELADIRYAETCGHSQVDTLGAT
jgi:hypothetical protein